MEASDILSAHRTLTEADDYVKRHQELIRERALWVTSLRFPEDRAEIAGLSLADKQWWYGTQDPQRAIDLGQDADFLRFWFWRYIVKTRVKRLWLFIWNPSYLWKRWMDNFDRSGKSATSEIARRRKS